MKRILIIFAATMVLMLLPYNINAQADAYNQMSAFIGPHLGIHKSEDSDEANYLVGGTVRLRLMTFLGAEGTISYRQEDFGDDALTVRNWPVTVSGLIYPLPIVYGGLGAGWYYTTYDFSDDLNDNGFEDETQHEFGWHLMAGVELPVSEKIHLSGDIRYVFLDYELKDLPDAVSNDVDANFYSINVALLFGL